VTVRSESGSRRDAIARRRWVVHIALIVGFLAAVLSAIELSKKYLGHSGVTDHAIIGLVVFGIVLVHLIQRRHTIGRLLTRMIGGSRETRLRLVWSDAILWFLILNVTVSGVVDFIHGQAVYLPIPGPYALQRWHELSALILLVYVIVHVIRRRNRLRNSRVR
jgi:hypothetical protein